MRSATKASPARLAPASSFTSVMSSAWPLHSSKSKRKSAAPSSARSRQPSSNHNAPTRPLPAHSTERRCVAAQISAARDFTGAREDRRAREDQFGVRAATSELGASFQDARRRRGERQKPRGPPVLLSSLWILAGLRHEWSER